MGDLIVSRILRFKSKNVWAYVRPFYEWELKVKASKRILPAGKTPNQTIERTNLCATTM